MTCHDTGDVAVAVDGQAAVALVGSPNVGKSTLFNSVTGARQRVVNAPGTTVELASGVWRGADVEVLDLPGAYSLLARTPDEQVTADTVAGRGRDVSLVVVLVDATAVARSLYVVGQVARTGTPAVVALTMRDVAASRGIVVDPSALSAALGVPVVGVDPRTGDGVDALAAAVRSALASPARLRAPADPPGRVGSDSAASAG
ncbi:FeoB small GTPase domain-containing protein, partial [Cellulomonas biazotea]|uniref:FeoB small GTPase domain-containing protein n=1 Tax=Cellulomonas biazotea TaxID=1709 RepID=UPI00158004DA